MLSGTATKHLSENAIFLETLDKNGGHYGIRTYDPLIKSQWVFCFLKFNHPLKTFIIIDV